MASISKRQRSGLSINGKSAFHLTLLDPIPQIMLQTFSIRRLAFHQEKQI
jgi:hypothetical protein